MEDMMRVRIDTNPGANSYVGDDEKVINYYLQDGSGGGLINFTHHPEDGTLTVDLTRHDPSVIVRASAPDGSGGAGVYTTVAMGKDGKAFAMARVGRTEVTAYESVDEHGKPVIILDVDPTKEFRVKINVGDGVVYDSSNEETR